ncbi:hypothetical protein BOTBODRAFT_178337 [Botryobasidium botryosum FD-172 SS1]|uniref:Uncharacterized protein n=1 Tax=Botryobasidium botryosum (strain FD-172 SS1) TaxID=930990 RepID=A0A067M6M9_BOTB1|nr:hypothetical protein BOTBODRAFT_178337 [Botryobasidium botryosum FD-172 SS1]
MDDLENIHQPSRSHKASSSRKTPSRTAKTRSTTPSIVPVRPLRTLRDLAAHTRAESQLDAAEKQDALSTPGRRTGATDRLRERNILTPPSSQEENDADPIVEPKSKSATTRRHRSHTPAAAPTEEAVTNGSNAAQRKSPLKRSLPPTDADQPAQPRKQARTSSSSVSPAKQDSESPNRAKAAKRTRAHTRAASVASPNPKARKSPRVSQSSPMRPAPRETKAKSTRRTAAPHPLNFKRGLPPPVIDLTLPPPPASPSDDPILLVGSNTGLFLGPPDPKPKIEDIEESDGRVLAVFGKGVLSHAPTRQVETALAAEELERIEEVDSAVGNDSMPAFEDNTPSEDIAVHGHVLSPPAEILGTQRAPSPANARRSSSPYEEEPSLCGLGPTAFVPVGPSTPSPETRLRRRNSDLGRRVPTPGASGSFARTQVFDDDNGDEDGPERQLILAGPDMTIGEPLGHSSLAYDAARRGRGMSLSSPAPLSPSPPERTFKSRRSEKSREDESQQSGEGWVFDPEDFSISMPTKGDEREADDDNMDTAEDGQTLGPRMPDTNRSDDIDDMDIVAPDTAIHKLPTPPATNPEHAMISGDVEDDDDDFIQEASVELELSVEPEDHGGDQGEYVDIELPIKGSSVTPANRSWRLNLSHSDLFQSREQRSRVDDTATEAVDDESDASSDEGGPPIVEISSKDPKAAARAAAILKMHHDYIEDGGHFLYRSRRKSNGSFIGNETRSIGSLDMDNTLNQSTASAGSSRSISRTHHYSQSAASIANASTLSLPEIMHEAEMEVMTMSPKIKPWDKGKAMSPHFGSDFGSPMMIPGPWNTLGAESTPAPGRSKDHAFSAFATPRLPARLERSASVNASSFASGPRSWSTEDWKQLEICFVEERRELARLLGMQSSREAEAGGVDLENVVARFLQDVDEEYLVGEWTRDKIMKRALALQIRISKQPSRFQTPLSRAGSSRLRSETPALPETPEYFRKQRAISSASLLAPRYAHLLEEAQAVAASASASTSVIDLTLDTPKRGAKPAESSYSQSFQSQRLVPTLGTPSATQRVMNVLGSIWKRAASTPAPDTDGTNAGPRNKGKGRAIPAPQPAPAVQREIPPELRHIEPAPPPARQTNRRVVFPLNHVPTPQSKPAPKTIRRTASNGSVKDLVRSFEDIRQQTEAEQRREKELLERTLHRGRSNASLRSLFSGASTSAR